MFLSSCGKVNLEQRLGSGWGERVSKGRHDALALSEASKGLAVNQHIPPLSPSADKQ